CAMIGGAALGLKSFMTQTPEVTQPMEKGRIIHYHLRNQKNVEEKAFKLILPDKAWAPDPDMRQRLGVTTAWKSLDAERDGWFALLAQDYGQVRPRAADLLRTGIEKLEQYYEGALELAEKAEPAQLCEVQGQRLLFKGQLNSVTRWGYLYMLAHQGFGYWL